MCEGYLLDGMSCPLALGYVFKHHQTIRPIHDRLMGRFVSRYSCFLTALSHRSRLYEAGRVGITELSSTMHRKSHQIEYVARIVNTQTTVWTWCACMERTLNPSIGSRSRCLSCLLCASPNSANTEFQKCHLHVL